MGNCKVIVNYYVRNPDTPQITVPFRRFRFFPGTGVCEKESRGFENLEQANNWIKTQKGLHAVNIHQTDENHRQEKRKFSRMAYPPGFWDKFKDIP